MINRVIAVGERSGWGSSSREAPPASGGTGGSSDTRERWVQFGAFYHSSLVVEQPTPAAAARGFRQQGAIAVQQPAAGTSGTGGGSGGDALLSSSSSSAATTSSGSRQLADYLALPLDQYSLLDPKWISREEAGQFKFSLPLQVILVLGGMCAGSGMGRGGMGVVGTAAAYFTRPSVPRGA